MFNNNIIRNIPYVIYLLLFSTASYAEEVVPAAAGSWISILPPVLTIAVALTLKRVVPALFLGMDE